MIAVNLNDQVEAEIYTPEPEAALARLEVKLAFQGRAKPGTEVDIGKFADALKRSHGNQVFAKGQTFIANFSNTIFLCSVGEMESASLGGDGESSTAAAGHTVSLGLFCNLTNVELHSDEAIKFVGGTGGGASTKRKQIFQADFNFERLGIGGLGEQIGDIFRRAFASRLLPPALCAKLGVNHVRGVLLYGPPGTGKTLIARQIGKMLNGKEPKVVNGPEVLSKYVGQSEENVRALFADAEIEQRERGDDSDLHIIIFDEIDAICKQRGTTGGNTGVGDTVVNQLLSKIDGVDSLNNILLIGMTNRKDMLDEALLRPGRLEVHVEISLPNLEGRVEILRIHTAKMRESKRLNDDVDLKQLAAMTKNYSGAEIEGLCKSAASWSFMREVDLENMAKSINEENIRVTMADFESALDEMKPAFGVATDEMENCLRNGYISYGPRFDELHNSIAKFVTQVGTSDRSPIVSVLLHGSRGSGKTAVAAKIALESDFPFVKVISPDSYVGVSEPYKNQQIARVFDDAYKSNLSCVVIDNIERLMEYTPIGPRFSNLVLQSLLVLIRKAPPKGRRLLVIGTTASPEVLEDVELKDAFDAAVEIPDLNDRNEVRKVLEEINCFDSPSAVEEAADAVVGQIAIKRLFMGVEMAREGRDRISLEDFEASMRGMGIPVKSDVL